MEAFAYCSSLASVTIPNSVTSIGEAAFFYCSGLISVTIGDSVTSIALETFAGCSSLTSVTIPNSVTSIGEAAFAGCSGLTSIDVDTSNPNYSSVNGILFNKLQDTLIQYPSGKIGDYTIPNSVMSIGNWAFYGCIGLTSITIPNSVTSVGNWAFYGCSGLTSITIPNSVTTIGDYAFAYCSDLTELHVKVQTPPALGDNPFMFVSDTIPVHVPCGTASVYQSASGWSGFSNYIDDLPLLNLTVESNDATMGTATIIQSNSCTDNTAIIQAVANQGYRFVQWNDGDTQNPRTITVTQDITYTAIFDTETGIPIVGTGHDLSLPQIYPNPATDNINIILPENRHQALFTLYDMQGKALIRKNINNWDVVSVSGLAAGIYVYSVKTATMSYTGKVVKE
jgi:Flp pilus assembly protein protease CpaA